MLLTVVGQSHLWFVMNKSLRCEEVQVRVPPSLRSIAAAEIINQRLLSQFTPEDKHIFNIAATDFIQVICEDWSRVSYWPFDTPLRCETRRARQLLTWCWAKNILHAFPYSGRTYVDKSQVNEHTRRSCKRKLEF